MRDGELLQIQRQATKDYRLALGLELKSRRTTANLSFTELAEQSNIPAETLRSYEKGTYQPQIVRLADIGDVYGASTFDILVSTAEYIYRANGEPIPDRRTVHPDRIALRAAVMYCGVTPAQLRMVESMPLAVPPDGRAWEATS